jgi:hypothetical protein
MSTRGGKPKAPKPAGGRVRNYRKEYDTYHGKPEQIRKRSRRNTDRREAEDRIGKLPTGMEVDHVTSMKNGGESTIGNLQILPRKLNRQKGADDYRFNFVGQPVAPQTEVADLDLEAAMEILRERGIV